MMEKTIRQRINKEREDLNNTINQLNLTDIYRTVHPTTAEYTFFSSAQSQKTSPNKCKSTEIIQSMFSDHR